MSNRVGQQIGNYRLVKLLGKGGFAEVYLGQHVHLASKQAAIKILLLSDVNVKQFQEEAETTEKLLHPHIVRLLDFAIEDGTPFLVLDYATGGSLRTRHPKGSIIPLATVRAYLHELAPALQYAHDLGILHRDIKPDNILIGRGGELLISDFGIAVLTQTGRTTVSSVYEIGGTPYYMAPETYKGKPVKESDQYALAVMVYEWLCGSVPFTEGNFLQLGFLHATEPVPPLREKNRTIAIPPQVEAVILKALSKEPRDRYGSVRLFVQAFEQAYLQTFPPDQFQHMGRGQPFVQPLVIPAGKKEQPLLNIPMVTAQNQSEASSSVVVQNRRVTRRTMLFLGLAGAGVTVTGIGWWAFSHGLPSNSGASSAMPRQGPMPIPRGTTLYTYHGHTDAVISVAWSPDGKYIASGSDDKTVQVWDAMTGTKRLTYTGHTDLVYAVAWSPDGKYIASGSNDKTVQVWDAMTGTKRLTYTGHTGPGGVILSVAWSPDGKYIASGSPDKTVQVWDALTGTKRLTYTGHSQGVNSVAWSPDSKEIASGSWDKTVQVWDALTGTKHVTYIGHTDAVRSVDWSPDGKYIASGSNDLTVQIWEAATGSKRFTYYGHATLLPSVAWSPDGKYIASGGVDETVQVWDAMTGNKRLTYTGHTGAVISVAWSPDGKYIASGSGDKTVQIWQAV